jgi:hypothetical protein
MREPPSAFVTSCGNRLTSFFGGFASPICRLRMADGGQIRALALVGRPGMADGGQIRALALVGRPGMAGGGSDRGFGTRGPSWDGWRGSDQGFGTRGPSWDGWRGFRSGLWHSWAVLGWLTGVRSGLWHSWAVLGWLAGGQIGALALVGRPGMAGGGSDRGSSNRLPSCDGRCRPSGAATAYVPPRAPCPASRSTHQPGSRVRFSMKNR